MFFYHQPLLRQLPAELCDLVIDNLRDDKKALQTTALTCSNWLPRSRFHLFQQLEVRDSAACQRLVEALKTTPVLIRYVKRLTLIFARNLSDWYGDELLLLPPALFQSVLHIVLFVPRWPEVGPSIKYLFYHRFSSLLSLSLFGLAFENHRELKALLEGSPHLQVLHINQVRLLRRPKALSYTSPHARIQRLSTALPVAGESGWLALNYDWQYLKYLVVFHVTLQNLPALGKLVRVTGARVRSLELNCVASGQWDEGNFSAQTEALGHTLGKRSLPELDMITLVADSFGAWVPLLLRVLCRRPLRRVVLRGPWHLITLACWKCIKAAVACWEFVDIHLCDPHAERDMLEDEYMRVMYVFKDAAEKIGLRVSSSQELLPILTEL